MIWSEVKIKNLIFVIFVVVLHSVIAIVCYYHYRRGTHNITMQPKHRLCLFQQSFSGESEGEVCVEGSVKASQFDINEWRCEVMESPSSPRPWYSHAQLSSWSSSVIRSLKEMIYEIWLTNPFILTASSYKSFVMASWSELFLPPDLNFNWLLSF